MRRYSDPIEVRSARVTARPDLRGDDLRGGDLRRDDLRGGDLRRDALVGTPVEVRTEQAEVAQGEVQGEANEQAETDRGSPPPQAFVWRGRLYVVREVIGHWRERRAWWREALDPVPGQPVGLDIASREQQVWRVEASPGRVHGTGVFDLVHDDVPHEGQTDWRLVRVAD